MPKTTQNEGSMAFINTTNQIKLLNTVLINMDLKYLISCFGKFDSVMPIIDPTAYMGVDHTKKDKLLKLYELYYATQLYLKEILEKEG